jgi:hypothetical protein
MYAVLLWMDGRTYSFICPRCADTHAPELNTILAGWYESNQYKAQLENLHTEQKGDFGSLRFVYWPPCDIGIRPCSFCDKPVVRCNSFQVVRDKELKTKPLCDLCIDEHAPEMRFIHNWYDELKFEGKFIERLDAVCTFQENDFNGSLTTIL